MIWPSSHDQARQAALTLLVNHGIIFNEDLPGFICPPCKRWMLPSNVAGHLNKNHGLAAKDKGALSKAVEVFAIANDFPRPTTVIKEVRGLPVFKAWKCQRCPFLCLYAESEDGAREKHKCPGGGIGEDNWTACTVQQLDTSAGRGLFEVIPEAPVAPERVEAMADRLRRQAEHTILRETKRRDDSTATINPWLQATGWLVMTEDRNPKEVSKAISTPEELPHLRQDILALFQSSIGLVDKTPGLVLRILNTENERKTCVLFFLFFFLGLHAKFITIPGVSRTGH